MIESVCQVLFSKWLDLNWSMAIVLVLGYVFIDGLYAYYTLSIARRSPIASANSGALIHLMLAVGVLSYVENFLYIIPIAFGSWIGTYLVVKYTK
jgi:hypothetical protein